MDFASHSERPSGIVAALASLKGNPLATRNLLKAKGGEDICGERVSSKSREFRDFRNFRNSDRRYRYTSAKFELQFVDLQGLDAGLESRGRNSELRCCP